MTLLLTASFNGIQYHRFNLLAPARSVRGDGRQSILYTMAAAFVITNGGRTHCVFDEDAADAVHGENTSLDMFIPFQWICFSFQVLPH